MSNRYETISITVTAITPRAIQVKDCDRQHWIPKSLISDESEVHELVVGEVADIDVQEWFLKKEGLL